MNSRINLTALVLVLCGLALPQAVNATVIGGSVTGGDAATMGGTYVKLTLPLPSSPANTVGIDNFDDWNLYAFDERQSVTLASDLGVDTLGNTGGAGLLTAGTTVSSHYVFFDPPGRTLVNQLGTITFDADILALVTSPSLLNNSDFLGLSQVNYVGTTFRGVEAGDIVTISDPRTITLDWSGYSPGDYIRVLTQASPVPAPGTFVLLAIGLIGWLLSRFAGNGRFLVLS